MPATPMNTTKKISAPTTPEIPSSPFLVLMFCFSVAPDVQQHSMFHLLSLLRFRLIALTKVGKLILIRTNR